MKRTSTVLLSVSLLLAAISVPDNGSTAAAEAAPATAAPPSAPDAVDPAQRDRVLSKDWRTSKDVAVTATGDADGFHVLAARSSDGYAWQTIATLSEPGMDTDQWVGNACLTSSGSKVLAVYAPRHFTNRAHLFSRGAFAAIINVATGAVTKLKDQVSLAYYNPGCGAGDQVALTQGTTDDHMSTRLFTVDADSGKPGSPVVVQSQVTSAIAVADSIIAAADQRLVRVEPSGELTTLAKTEGVPFALRATADGGIAFMDRAGDAGEVRVRHHRQGTTRTLATGYLGDLALHAGAGNRVFVTGQARGQGALPDGVSLIGGPPQVQSVSSEGALLIKSAVHRGLKRDGQSDQANTGFAGIVRERPGAEPVDIEAQVSQTGSPLTFAVEPDGVAVSPSGGAENPKLTQARAQIAKRVGIAAASPGTIDINYTCAVPRNDPKTQVYQPHWRQVEWAVDQLVFKNRLQVVRPSSWKGIDVPQWNPQALFPVPDLVGGGRVPVSVMFGILAQESNLWQAQRDVLPGETGNPLVGNYYGVEIYDDNPNNDWDIRFDKADCGYGLTQQTDGMRKGAGPWDAATQRRIGMDYVTNIASGLTTLAAKWNEIHTDTGGTMKVNNGDPQWIENWYFAIWAYNSGYYPKAQASANGGAWGLGWTNNPRNSDYPASRRPFLDNNSYADAAHPQHWPYQEKVLGWAAWPIAKTYFDTTSNTWKTEGGYNYAWWNSTAFRSNLVPTLPTVPATVDVAAFCTAENECEPATSCSRSDWHCWWHSPKGWKTCPNACGNEAYLRYDASYAGIERAEPEDQWTPCYTPGLPATTGDTTNVLIIDDVPSSVPPQRGNCFNTAWTNSGTLSFEFESDPATGDIPGRADFGQLGNGFGGHLWYGYTRNASHLGDPMKVTGTWELNQAINGWARVLVHVPKRRAETQQAPYTVDLGNGQTRTRHLSQGRLENNWQNLGVFEFKGVPKVALTNRNQEGDGTAAVAWDAIAFQVLAKKPKHFVVGMGDSFSSGEGAGNYYRETDTGYKNSTWNACRRSKDAWIRQTVLPGETQTVGQLADSFNPKLDFSFVACSGAVTRDMTVPEYTYTTIPINWSDYRGNAEGRFREAAQLESGYLDENTTLVALSIGGNDASFSSVVTNCWIWTCYTAGYEADIKADVTAAVFNKTVGTEQANVKNILESIDTRVQNFSLTRGKKAQIVLMGYPEITGTGVLDCGAFDQDEQSMMQRMAEHFAAEDNKMVQAAKAAGVEVSFANPMPAFQGHGACKPESERWITPVTFAKTGPGDFDDVWSGCISDGFRCASRTSMHPNAAGAQAYAGVLTTHLQSLGYTGW
ncbi:SGNH/GDSL hydrolase family protein [Nonomuraea wenchangensis]|uniref:SGNH/GDSL hydrolase family protein n=1 Tax=Nonomuraea wenchangensis TaxID=568860 RepID=UPI0033C4904A